MSKSKKQEQSETRRKRVVRVVPVIERAAETCERVGDKVAYPPFLMQYDARSEGERAVKARVCKREEK